MEKEKPNPVGWFEIPVSKMERAIKFYEDVFGYKLERHQVGELDMAWFPMSNNQQKPGSTGSLVYHKEWYKPSGFDGVMIYFVSHTGDLNHELGKIEKAGGKILQKKKPIGEHGFVAFFTDTEGNRIALHSMK